MSLLALVKTVMEGNGWKIPVISVAASQDPNIRQAFVLANKELESLAYSRTWPILVTEQTLALVGGQAEYPLPADFHHLVTPSVYNKSQYYRIKGNLQPMEFIRYISNNGGGPNMPYTGFRILPATKTLRVVPTPQQADEVVYFYVSSNLVLSAAATPQPRYAADDDVAVVDETLLEMGLTWRWRQKKGLDYSAEIAEYNGTVTKRYAQQLALSDFPIGASIPPGQAPLTDGFLPFPIVGP